VSASQEGIRSLALVSHSVSHSLCRNSYCSS